MLVDVFVLPQSSAGVWEDEKADPQFSGAGRCELLKVLLRMMACESSFPRMLCGTPMSLLSSSVVVPTLSVQPTESFRVPQEVEKKMRLGVGWIY